MDSVVDPSQPTPVDTEEVLRQFGLDGIENSRTVVHNVSSNSSVVIQETPQVSSAPSFVPEETVQVIEETQPEESSEATPIVVALPEPTVDGVSIQQTTAHTEAVVVESEYDDDEEDELDSFSNSDNGVVVSEEPAHGGTVEPVNIDEQPLEDLVGGFLPTNSQSLLVDETSARFSGASWYTDILKQTVIIAGIGGIGSWASMILSRLKPQQMFLYDDDYVETVNLAGQLYGMGHVGSRKVSAMNTIISDFSNYYGVMSVAERWTSQTPTGDIMICGFDNMEARRTFFDSWVRHVRKSEHPEKCLFIDGRLAFTDMQVFSITGTDAYNIRRYFREYLFTDSQAEETVCSMKQTTYCASMIGSLIVNIFTNFIASQQDRLLYSVPFKTYYDSSVMYFKTEN